jgi:type II secretory pathway pseudopilin PulG
MNRRAQRGGFTLVEVMIGTVLMVLAVAMTCAGLVYVMAGERRNSIQMELDLDVRKATERITHDLRLSAIEKMLYYPAGSGSCTGVSFPIAITNAAAPLLYDADGKIIWTRTVVFHVWTNLPNELRMTVFQPRNNSLTDAQRQEQLNSVVLYGNGSRTYESNKANTYVIFRNLFDWSISSKGAIFDGYSPVAHPEAVTLGTFTLSNGMHRFKFKVKGKNPSSSGYRIAIDTLAPSPCGSEREAEAQLPVYAISGPAAFADYMPGGSWSGNWRLNFPATAVDQYFTLQLDNDRWEETNFEPTGAEFDKTLVEWNDGLMDFVVRLAYGWTAAWLAEAQTRYGPQEALTNDLLRGAAIRVLMRGNEMLDGGFIKAIGSRCFVRFGGDPSVATSLRVEAAYIAEAASREELTMDITGASYPLPHWWSGTTSFDVNSTNTYAGPASLTIDKDKSYIVSYLVSMGAPKANPYTWTDATRPMTNSFFIPRSSGPGVADLLDPTWSDRGDVIATNSVLGVNEIWVCYPEFGTYTTPIFDTHLDAPAYNDLWWTSSIPSGCSITMKFRCGSSNDLADALAFSNITTVITTPGTALTAPAKRYCQVQATLYSNPGGVFAGWDTPLLRALRVRWTGQLKTADIGGVFSKGPDHGIFELTVDDQPLTRGVTINLEIYDDAITFGGKRRRITSAVATEIEPRNSGK